MEILRKTSSYASSCIKTLSCLASSLRIKYQSWIHRCVCIVICLSLSIGVIGQTQKHRLVVLTDIGNEPDDSQSMVRLLLYANQIDIEGLIASTSVHQPKQVNPQLIHKLIEAYQHVQPNLLLHEAGFPSGKQLKALVKSGLPICGMEAVGEGNDSEGSDWIIKVIEKKDTRPIWITVWGGTNTLAQTLWKLKQTKSEVELNEIIRKLRVYTISDQDDSGAWIRENFKDLFYIVSPGGNYNSATWSAMVKPFEGANNEVISNTWITQNIQQEHGPLGALYPEVEFGVEGDTPSWLSLIPNGLNAAEHPNWGGWGGRYELYIPSFTPYPTWFFQLRKETRAIWTDAIDEYTPLIQKNWGKTIGNDSTTFTSNHATIWRWREEFQNDFAARMD